MSRTRSILLFLIALLLVPVAGQAGSRVPSRTAQITQTPEEPPLADQPRVPVPGTDFPGSPEFPAVGEATEPVDPPTPIVSIRVRVPSTSASGQDLEYRLCVKNSSQAAAHQVTVRCVIPATARYVRATPQPASTQREIVWRLGTMQGGVCRELRLVLQPTGGDVSLCARVVFEHGQCVTTRIGPTGSTIPPVPTGLTIRKTGPAQVAIHDAVTYRVEVANTGNAPLNDVIITDILPRELRYVEATPEPDDRRALLRWSIGTLNAGESRIIEYRALALQKGTFTNRAVVTAAGGLRQEATSQLTVGKPGLSLRIVAPENRYADLPAVHELIVRNTGDAPANNVIIVNPLPTNTRFVSASSGGILVGSEVQWNLGTLAIGAKKNLFLQLQAQAEGEIRNRATAKADGEVTAHAESKTAFKGQAGLQTRLVDKGPLVVGEESEFILILENTGTADAGNVKVVATMPPEMEATDAKGPGKKPVQPNSVVFESGSIKPGEKLRYSIYAKALKPGDARFRVEITSDVLKEGPLREETSTPIIDDR